MSVKVLRVLLRLCLFLCIVPAVAEAVEVSATAAVLLDADTGQVLYEKNGDQRMLIASTTKIMTALVVLEQASLDDTITVTQAHMAEGSSMYLKPGETVRVAWRIRALLIPTDWTPRDTIPRHGIWRRWLPRPWTIPRSGGSAPAAV